MKRWVAEAAVGMAAWFAALGAFLCLREGFGWWWLLAFAFGSAFWALLDAYAWVKRS